MSNQDNNPLSDYFRSQHMSGEAGDRIRMECSRAVRQWRIRRSLLALPLFATVGLLFVIGPWGREAPVSTGSPVPLQQGVSQSASTFVIALRPHSPQCPDCSRAGVVLETLRTRLGDQAVRFAELDYSSADGRRMAQEILRESDLTETIQPPTTHAIVAVHGKQIKLEVSADLDPDEIIQPIEAMVRGVVETQ